jgi:hypothetical protein
LDAFRQIIGHCLWANPEDLGRLAPRHAGLGEFDSRLSPGRHGESHLGPGRCVGPMDWRSQDAFDYVAERCRQAVQCVDVGERQNATNLRQKIGDADRGY